MIPFGKWRPDIFETDAGVAGDASGVLPGANYKAPWPSLQAFSEALEADCRGAFFARKSDGSTAIYAATADSLWLYDGADSPWVDVSGTSYSLPDGDRWSFDQFGTQVIACNVADNPQKLDVDAGTAATDLGGSPPKARIVRTIGDHLWLLNLSDNPMEARWSGTNDSEWWTLGERDCDLQVFPDGGDLTGITSIETGLIFQRSAIRRFAVTGDRSIYSFARLDDSRGLVAPDSLVTKGGMAFFLSEEGFIGMDASGSATPIGLEQIDKWFQDRVDPANRFSVYGCVDPLRARVFWLYPSGSTNDALMTGALCYDIALQEWTHADLQAYVLLPGAGPGTTLEGLDALGYTLDTLPFSLDSRQFIGGAPLLAAVGADRKLSFFSGANMAARIETGEFQPVPNYRSFIRSVLPRTDSADATVQVGSRETLQAGRAWGASSAVNAQGRCPTRASGRYHRVRVSMPEGAAWQQAQGVEIDAVPDGQR